MPDSRAGLTWEVERAGDFVWVRLEWEVPWWRRWFFGEPDDFVFGMHVTQMQGFVDTLFQMSEVPCELRLNQD